MLFISRLKRPYSFSPIYFQVIVILLVIMLSVSFLIAVISPHSCFLCSPQVVVSMRQHCLQCWQILFLPLFLIHIVCQRRLWDVMPYALSLVFFFVLLSICLSSSLVHFRKGPEYLTRGTAQVFIPLIRFLFDSFLVLQKYSFLIFSFIFTCLMASASKMPKYS